MTLFVDTSALLAFLDADRPRHSDAVDAWRKAIHDRETLVTSNYVLVETFALVQRRLGLDALRDLANDVLPLMEGRAQLLHERVEPAILQNPVQPLEERMSVIRRKVRRVHPHR